MSIATEKEGDDKRKGKRRKKRKGKWGGEVKERGKGVEKRVEEEEGQRGKR